VSSFNLETASLLIGQHEAAFDCKIVDNMFRLSRLSTNSLVLGNLESVLQRYCCENYEYARHDHTVYEILDNSLLQKIC
jgi:hypothetical protein